MEAFTNETQQTILYLNSVSSVPHVHVFSNDKKIKQKHNAVKNNFL